MRFKFMIRDWVWLVILVVVIANLIGMLLLAEAEREHWKSKADRLEQRVQELTASTKANGE